MLAVGLPVLCFAAVLRRENLRESFLFSAVACGIFVVFTTEILSLFEAVAYAPLVTCWCGYLLALLLWRYRVRSIAPGAAWPDTTPLQKVLLALIACIVVVTGTTAIVAAPNNFDSLTYHLPRVMHWIQNRSVAHYPTHIDRQLVLAPFSEFVIMHLQILSGGDRFANCVQWFSLVGSAVGVSLVARALKGSLNSQIVAAALSVSLPMGLLQSTSTQNDYVTAFWLVCLVYFLIKARECPDARHALLVGVSLALAIFTKGTAYLVAAPFMVAYLWHLGTRGTKSAATGAGIVFCAIVLVNGGHYARNLKLYGNPISPGSGNDIVCTRVDATSVISGVTKNVATQLATGFEGANGALNAWSNAVHRAIGVDAGDPGLTTNDGFFILPPRVQGHEDYAPNPVHMVLMLLAAAMLCWRWKKIPVPLRLFATTAMLSFVALSAGIKWNPFVSRYYLPVFVVSAPFLALLADGEKQARHIALCAALLLLLSFPVLANNPMRPLLGPNSVLVTERIDQYFMVNPAAKAYFVSVTDLAKARTAVNVGLLNDNSNMWEYLLWVLLNGRGDRYRIEHVGVENPSGRIKLRGFTDYFPISI